MNIVYACDSRYAMGAGISIASLYEHHAETENLRVYILAFKVDDESKSKLSALAEPYGRQIHFVEAAGVFGAARLYTGQWSAAAYARLYMPELLPHLDKVIYLDCDVLVADSLLPIWETDLRGFSCAAASEPFSALHKQNIGLKAEDIYFNTGVMLIHLEDWRKARAKERFLECFAKHCGRVPYVDQGLLNEVFAGQVLMLPARYNVYTEYFDFSYGEIERYRAGRFAYSKDEIKRAVAEPAVIHLTGSFLTARPWCEGSGHPYAEKWLQYKERSPWKDMPLWKNRLSIEKAALNWIFTFMPRTFGIAVARMANSVIRPLIDRGMHWMLRQKPVMEKKRPIAGPGAPS